MKDMTIALSVPDGATESDVREAITYAAEEVLDHLQLRPGNDGQKALYRALTHVEAGPKPVSAEPHRGELWELLRILLIENDQKGRSPSDNATDVLSLINDWDAGKDTETS